MSLFVVKIDRSSGVEQALQFAEVAGSGGVMNGGSRHGDCGALSPGEVGMRSQKKPRRGR
jgi:hypothetical protein